MESENNGLYKVKIYSYKHGKCILQQVINTDVKPYVVLEKQ
jgi:hypothetical protein